MVSATEKLNFKFYLSLTDLNVNNYMYLVAIILASTALDCYMREKQISVLFELPYFWVYYSPLIYTLINTQAHQESIIIIPGKKAHS